MRHGAIIHTVTQHMGEYVCLNGKNSLKQLHLSQQKVINHKQPIKNAQKTGIFNINKDTESNLIGHVVPVMCHTYLL